MNYPPKVHQPSKDTRRIIKKWNGLVKQRYEAEKEPGGQLQLSISLRRCGNELSHCIQEATEHLVFSLDHAQIRCIAVLGANHFTQLPGDIHI